MICAQQENYVSSEAAPFIILFLGIYFPAFCGVFWVEELREQREMAWCRKCIAPKVERPTASRDGVFAAHRHRSTTNQMKRNQKNCRIYDCYVNCKNNLLLKSSHERAKNNDESTVRYDRMDLKDHLRGHRPYLFRNKKPSVRARPTDRAYYFLHFLFSFGDKASSGQNLKYSILYAMIILFPHLCWKRTINAICFPSFCFSKTQSKKLK